MSDADGDGKADRTIAVLTGLRKPHGLAFWGGKLFVAEETRVSRYFWDGKNLSARLDRILFDLPKGGRHFTRSLAFDKDGRLFISVGSTCDVCYEEDERLAAVLVSDSEGANPRVFAKGLRNSVFIAVNPRTKELWGTEMGRDFLGDSLPPDEINVIKENPSTGSGRVAPDYGWPICYGNKKHDASFDKRTSIINPCLSTEAPIYEITAHSAPLGLTFIDSPQFPADWQGDLLVAYHGSWNRSSPIGYKVVRLRVSGNQVLTAEDFLTGFLPDKNLGIIGPEAAYGRPVDLVFDRAGRLYVSDDKAGNVYLIRKTD